VGKFASSARSWLPRQLNCKSNAGPSLSARKS
jgi:hypothetical protein